MGRSPKMTSLMALLVVALMCGIAWTAVGTQAIVLTTQGRIAQGTLSGLGPLIQLRSPYSAQIIGPHQQYDVPVSSIRQITLDFPRVIIEADSGVIIGPYSAFLGIAEILTLVTGTTLETTRIPVTSVRAIALHGASLRPVPREWMGDRFLSGPEIAAATPLLPGACVGCDVTSVPTVTPPASDDDERVVWGTFTPEAVEEDPASSLWWVGLAAAAVLLAVFFLINP